MKQITWIYIALFGLAAAFIGVTLAIRILGPRQALVARKLKIGATIISFNTLLAGCWASNDGEAPPTCYGAPPQPEQDAGDTATESGGTDTTQIPDSEIMCYDTDQCYETDTGSDSDTGTEPGADSDTVDPCYSYIDSEVECYDVAEEYPTDSESTPTDSESTPTDSEQASTDSEQTDDDSDSLAPDAGETGPDGGTHIPDDIDSDIMCYIV